MHGLTQITFQDVHFYIVSLLFIISIFYYNFDGWIFYLKKDLHNIIFNNSYFFFFHGKIKAIGVIKRAWLAKFTRKWN